MRKLAMGIFVTLAVSMGGSGCGKPAATCENVGKHVKELMLSSDSMKKAPEDQRKVAASMLDSFAGDLTKKCQDDKWDAKQIDCILAAKSTDEMEKCGPAKK